MSGLPCVFRRPARHGHVQHQNLLVSAKLRNSRTRQHLALTSLSCTKLNTKFNSYSSFLVSVTEDCFPRVNDGAAWSMADYCTVLWEAQAWTGTHHRLSRQIRVPTASFHSLIVTIRRKRVFSPIRLGLMEEVFVPASKWPHLPLMIIVWPSANSRTHWYL